MTQSEVEGKWGNWGGGRGCVWVELREITGLVN